jgi:hypothetical protein
MTAVLSSIMSTFFSTGLGLVAAETHDTQKQHMFRTLSYSPPPKCHRLVYSSDVGEALAVGALPHTHNHMIQSL